MSNFKPLPDDVEKKVVALLQPLEEIGIASIEHEFTTAIIISHGKTYACMIQKHLPKSAFDELQTKLYSVLEHHDKILFETPASLTHLNDQPAGE
jgi:hypothetical protein